jgi:hypothetical protein
MPSSNWTAVTTPSPSIPMAASAGITNWTCPVIFAAGTLPTTGPTQIVTGATYWLVGSTVSGNNFQIADTAADALTATNVYTFTSGTPSGVTMTLGAIPGASSTYAAGGGMTLPAGNWVCTGNAATYLPTGNTGTGTTAFNAAVTTTPTSGRPSSGLGWMGYSGIDSLTTSVATSGAFLAVNGVLEKFSTPTPVYISNAVTNGTNYAQFITGGGVLCTRNLN